MAAHPATETIAAIATAPGTGGIGIIRISGPDALALLRAVFVPRTLRSHFTSHTLYYGTIVDRQGRMLDEALAVYMLAPHTYTREDVVELHCHGSYLVLQAILRTVIAWGCRLAEPGEFTKRAFLAGRIDLTRAEAVIDLLQAQTEAGARLAANQLQGQLFDRLEAVRQRLIGFLALLEVAIDFPDDDVEIFDTTLAATQLQTGVIAPLEQLIALAEQGRIVREGVKVVIAGRPNVGKSSLLNALLREERALVTPVPGTTRDTVEERIDIHGIPVHLVDTAGIRRHEDAVEALGIERARRKLAEADLVLFVVDASAGMEPRDRELYETVREKRHLVVLNKCDLVAAGQVQALAGTFAGATVVTISARQGEGIEALQEAVYQILIAGSGFTDQIDCAPNTRHRAVLVRSVEACQRFGRAMATGAPVDLLAVEVQTALDELGDITGLTTPDEVLDAVFSQFCIGK
ncbi:tRNA uridine-5-carboxymethylaminomethyl(34) synthesis GTPase MnmE [Desulfobulbus elongatus]|uniref:tRNA uridine-5-carboxymethylaminomethyl(34) synthesis GTPase MnmE n=1 Tax=Desulfobulbus elongatus TaxID=53332 RepID=UPI0004852933|nr:tRNA uridine-5-carboxymethylaminomethyl(34) synthesis GTPase MnmE [Desulfobulbus elongatus]